MPPVERTSSLVPRRGEIGGAFCLKPCLYGIREPTSADPSVGLWSQVEHEVSDGENTPLPQGRLQPADPPGRAARERGFPETLADLRQELYRPVQL